jgi:hypothetical protein
MPRPFVLGLALLVGCGGRSSHITELQSETDATVTLRIGETQAIAGTPLRFTFRAVPEDWRCAVDVVCVSAGNAVVELAVAADRNAFAQTVKLHLYGEPREVGNQGHLFSLLDLQPGRLSGRPVPLEQYRATIRVRTP